MLKKTPAARPATSALDVNFSPIFFLRSLLYSHLSAILLRRMHRPFLPKAKHQLSTTSITVPQQIHTLRATQGSCWNGIPHLVSPLPNIFQYNYSQCDISTMGVSLHKLDAGWVGCGDAQLYGLLTQPVGLPVTGKSGASPWSVGPVLKQQPPCRVST